MLGFLIFLASVSNLKSRCSERCCTTHCHFPRLQYAHIEVCYFWPCVFPLFWYATIATSVLPAADFTLGKSSPPKEDRLYFAELFGCLGNKRVLPDGLAECVRIDSMLAILQESQQRSCKRTSSEKLDPHSLPIRCRFGAICPFSSTNHTFQ